MIPTLGDKECPKCNGAGVIHDRVRYIWQRTSTGERVKVEQERIPLIPNNLPSMYYYTNDYPYPQWIVEAGECPCRVMARQAAQLSKTAGKDSVSTQYDQYTFDDFSDQEIARDAALEFVKNMRVSINDITRPGLLFVGATGVHKSCLAYMIYRELLSQGIIGSWWLSQKLIDAEQDTYDEHFSGDRDTFIKACRTPFLVLDDLGDKRPGGTVLEISPNRQEIMFRLFEHREAKQLPTVCTTNLKKQELYAHFGDRITSRILGLCHLVPMVGKDSRVG